MAKIHCNKVVENEEKLTFVNQKLECLEKQ